MKQNIYQHRLAVVRTMLEEWQVDGLLVTSPANRRWLSGFTGSAGKLLITADKALLATDFRYWTQAAAEAHQFTLYKQVSSQEDADAFIRSAGAVTIGLEALHTTLNEMNKNRRIEGINWKQIGGDLEELRQVKSEEELKAIRAAARITDLTMSQFPKLARPGLTERQLAWELEKFMREAGAESLSFPVIVSSGPNAAKPHHRWSERAVQIGDPIIVDMGAVIDGYGSDLTRTFHLGGEPNQKFWDVYSVVDEAQRRALTQMEPGMLCREVDALARDVIAAAGYKEQFGHGLGHGVGLAGHEKPQLSSLAPDSAILLEGVVVTVEPGIYIEGWGGVRIEDLVLTTAEGVEFLSQCPKTPVIEL
ncbi:MAG: aminopeptidase P family protein [Chloroflexi bacterium]|nr:aminopeptidase P family protein [Chloroflexota bacterium]